jgi:hypothetical protein
LIRPRRFSLPAFLALFILLFASFAIVQRLGSPSVPQGSVAIVEGVPPDLGLVTDAEFHRALAQSAAQSQIEPIPKPGEDQYDTLREAALRSLFDPIWIRGQAEEMGISVTPQEVGEELEALKQNYKTEREYKEFLSASDSTTADIEETVETQVISTRIGERVEEGVSPPSERAIEDYYAAAKSSSGPIGAEPLDEARTRIEKRLTDQGVEEASGAYLQDYIDRWTARTYCAAGFAVVTHCSNFDSDGRPPESNPACYEAKPAGGPASTCPAPVMQPKPAQPGTVGPLDPEGLRLAQMPQPPGSDEAPPAAAGE